MAHEVADFHMVGNGTPYGGEAMIAAMGITEDGTKRMLGVRQGATENAAYHETDYDQALKGLKTTARWLERLNPDAAASLREGMEETLTVVRLADAGVRNAAWRVQSNEP
jgi:hypothetical protein